jgi:hypothetical protein
VTLTDGDVAALARQAVDLLDPRISIRIDPDAADDPYRWGRRSWLVETAVFQVYVSEADEASEALARMLEAMSGEITDPEHGSARAFPTCPGHVHPARVAVDGRDVVFRCPDTDEVVARVRPDLPS